MHKPRKEGFGIKWQFTESWTTARRYRSYNKQRNFTQSSHLSLMQGFTQRRQDDVQVRLPLKGMAQAQMLLMQAADTEQFAGGNHHLLGQQALEDLAHIHCSCGAQLERGSGSRRTVGQLVSQMLVQALAHFVRLLT